MKYFRSCISIVLILSISFLNLSCTQSPVSSIRQGLEDLSLKNRVLIERQRGFVVPAMSHVLLELETMPDTIVKAGLFDSLMKAIREEGVNSFGKVFTNVSLQIDAFSKPTGSDFTFKISVLDVVSRVEGRREQKNNDNKKNDIKYNDVSIEDKYRLRPYELALKIELIDTRLKKSLDVAHIQSRSGAFGAKSLQDLLRVTFVSYSNSITAQQLASY